MLNVLENGDFIVLGEDQQYFVVKSVKYNDKNYALIREITEEFLYDNGVQATDEWAEEIVVGEELSLSKVTDNEIIKALNSNSTQNPL